MMLCLHHYQQPSLQSQSRQKLDTIEIMTEKEERKTVAAGKLNTGGVSEGNEILGNAI